MPHTPSNVRHQAELLFQLTRRDIFSRYRGSALGVLWSFITPLLLVGVYTFVFSIIFSPRWLQEGQTLSSAYGYNLFIGVIIHGMLAESITRAPSLVLGNTTYVTKVVFPLHLLPSVATLSELFHLIIGIFALLTLQLVLGAPINWGSLILTPLVILPLLFLCNGMILIISALGVYFRDISQIASVVVAALMFLSPVFYPIEAVPEAFRLYIYINPMTYIIDGARLIVLQGRAPNFGALAIITLACVVLFALGLTIFQRLRRGFADVL